MFTLKTILKCSNYQIIRSSLARQWHKQPIPVAWTRPEIGWTKLNFDGSSKGKKTPGRASIGGVLRDHDAQFLLGYAEPIGRANSTMAELTALTKGLELVLENGWKDVWVEGDAKGLVEIIVENKEVKCVEARSHFRFASIGHRYKKLEIWREIPPLEILDMMRQDAEGKITFRRINTRNTSEKKMCNAFSIPGVTPEGTRLYLFPYTLRDEARR
ncbi:uncharacterized protein LOC120083578 [Benincasa hispida]|uniref:uncharacterized protein LOC120083578 n=1 Tax=Benincasa hispida TaxID=102211 RepID=UPI001900A027|nr:uncharacterized protein LOC120083578 [Benincasa hispida]